MPGDVSELRESLQREHVAALQAMVAANGDLNERLQRATVAVFYDTDADMVMITFDASEMTVAESVDNRVIFRMDIDTRKIVGIDILGFGAHAARDPRLMRVFVSAIQTPGATFESFSGTTETLADELRELVPV